MITIIIKMKILISIVIIVIIMVALLDRFTNSLSLSSPISHKSTFIRSFPVCSIKRVK